MTPDDERGACERSELLRRSRSGGAADAQRPMEERRSDDDDPRRLLGTTTSSSTSSLSGSVVFFLGWIAASATFLALLLYALPTWPSSSSSSSSFTVPRYSLPGAEYDDLVYLRGVEEVDRLPLSAWGEGGGLALEGHKHKTTSSSHGQYHEGQQRTSARNDTLPPPHVAEERCEWVVDLFTEKYAGTSEEKLATQYRVQSADPNFFYRATANIFWIDFAKNGWGERLSFENLGVRTVHRDGTPFQPKSTWTWVTGDQHLTNFGAWRNRHGDPVFGVNDFDEAAIYDFQVDVLRIAVSVVGHARSNRLFGKLKNVKWGDGSVLDSALRAFTDTYVQTLIEYVGGDRELLFEITPDTATGVLRTWLESVRDDKSRTKLLSKFTEMHHGERRFTRDTNTRLVDVSEEEEAEIRDQFTSQKYGATMMKVGWHVRNWDDEYFRVLDIARRVGSGVGSYGVDRYYVLLAGKDHDANDWTEDDDSVILDVKYEPPGAVSRVLSDDDAAWYREIFDHDAQRAVEGQRRLTSYTDPFTGWVMLGGKSFVVRQRSPWKASPDFHMLTDPIDYIEVMEQVAIATATSHARGTAAKSPGQFKHVIAAALGRWSDRTKWGKALAEAAKEYHDQVLLDFECFRKFVDDKYGRADP